MATAQSAIGTTNVSRRCSGKTQERARRLQVVTLEKLRGAHSRSIYPDRSRASRRSFIPHEHARFSPQCHRTGREPALRIAFTVALLLIFGAGAFIYRRRDRAACLGDMLRQGTESFISDSSGRMVPASKL